MSEFFKGFLSREIVSLTVMLAVLLARLLFRRAPKRLTVLLWAVVCFRLLCPVSIDAPVSLVPKAAAQAARSWPKARPNRWQRCQAALPVNI